MKTIAVNVNVLNKNDEIAAKNRKALTVTTANHKTLRGLLAEICHRIVTKKQYAVDYKAVKQQ